MSTDEIKHRETTLKSTLARQLGLLLAGDPHLTDKSGTVMVSTLASRCGCRRQSIYKSFAKERLTIDMARNIVKASRGRVKLEDLLSFL